MDSDGVNRWLSLGANIAVLIGIALLIIELDQNRDMMRAQTRHQISEETRTFLTDTAYSEEMASILVRLGKGEELSEEESLQYQFRVMSWFRVQENVHYQVRQGLFDESEFLAFTGAWKAYVNRNNRIREVWCSMRSNYSTEYQTAMNASFINLQC